MWGLPRPGIEPVSPALAGGFLTTAPPGKPLLTFKECSKIQKKNCKITDNEHYVNLVNHNSTEIFYNYVWILFNKYSDIVTECKFVCPTHSESKQPKHQSLEQRKGLLQGHARRWVGRAPKTSNSPKGFSKALLKANWREGGMVSYKLLGARILHSCSCPHRS